LIFLEARNLSKLQVSWGWRRGRLIKRDDKSLPGRKMISSIALNEIVRADWAVKGGEVHAQYAVERMVLAIASGGRLVKSPDQSTAWRKV